MAKAEAEEKKVEEKKQEPPKAESSEKTEKAQAPAPKTGTMTWIVLIVVVAVLAGSGFVLGRIFAGSSVQDPHQPQDEVKKDAKEGKHGAKKESKPSGGHGKKEEAAPEINTDEDWYFNGLESVVVNPDEPGATRYVRVGLTLEMAAGYGADEATELITSKKPLLINWLNLFFKSMTLSEMQTDRDMKRILVQICDAFNEILFPGAKPQIKRILIREFNIQ